MGRKLVRAGVLLVVATILVQGAGAGVAANQTGQAGATAPADVVYVQESGDAVLVYNETASMDGPNETELGVSMAENLAHLRMTDPVEETPDVQGAIELIATQTDVSSEGNLSMPAPDTLDSFSLDLSGETTEENAEADLTLSTTVQDPQGTTQMLESASTSGEVTIGAESMTASGELTASTSESLPAALHQSMDASFREESDGYVLTVDEDRIVNPMTGQAPEDRQQAEQLLEQQFGGTAALLGGNATVEIEEFSRSQEDQATRLQQAYTVRLQGIDQGLQQVLTQQLATSQEISDEQAGELATALTEAEINEVGVEYTVDDSGVEGNVQIDVENYGDLLEAYFDVVESLDTTDGMSDTFEQLRTQFEAQRAADLEQTLTWSGSLSHPSEQSVQAEFEADSSANNWAGYVDELESRDAAFVTSDFELTGGIEDERLAFDGSASMSGDDLYATMLGSMPSQGEMPAESAAMVEALRDSRPEKARLVASHDADGTYLEAGAAFGNLTALRDAARSQGELPNVTSAVGQMNATGGETYVTVSGAVEGEVTEENVREMAAVDSETTVHMPEDWDREFPAMDTERAREFLDVETTDSNGPGFGAVAALVAIVAAALIARRRN